LAYRLNKEFRLYILSWISIPSFLPLLVASYYKRLRERSDRFIVFKASGSNRLVRAHLCKTISQLIARMRSVGFDPADFEFIFGPQSVKQLSNTVLLLILVLLIARIAAWLSHLIIMFWFLCCIRVCATVEIARTSAKNTVALGPM
jgi:hypothetical protein